MERHGEIVRQWRLLLALESVARGLGLADLRAAAGEAVSERTIRRDLTALAQAGFPIETTRQDGRTRYSLNRDVFGGLAVTGLSLSELCALYLSRTMLTALAGGPFHDSLASAFDKLADALPPALWRFVDELPSALAAKAAAARTPAGGARFVDALVGAILARRRVRMRYHSFASRQVKEYLVEPYRVAYAQGTLYLFAFVPLYGEMRTFAVQRLADLTVLEETFSPTDAGPGIFPDSLGAFSGPPARVIVDFAADQAPYIRERDWHASQRLEDLPDGGVRLTLDVAIDWGLEAWLLGFGESARVIEPASLVTRLVRRLDRARAQYTGGRAVIRRLPRRPAASIVRESVSALPQPQATSVEASDETLLAALRARADGAFEQLVRLHGGRLLAVTRRLLGNEEDARDAVQETFLNAYRGLDRFEGGSLLSTWLHRIAVNVSLMKLRRRKRKPEQSLDHLLPAFNESGHFAERFDTGEETAEQRLARVEEEAAVRAAIDELPDQYRTVLLLRDIEGLGTNEVAEQLGVTANAVKLRLHRARQALRTLVAPRLGRR